MNFEENKKEDEILDEAMNNINNFNFNNNGDQNNPQNMDYNQEQDNYEEAQNENEDENIMNNMNLYNDNNFYQGEEMEEGGNGIGMMNGEVEIGPNQMNMGQFAVEEDDGGYDGGYGNNMNFPQQENMDKNEEFEYNINDMQNVDGSGMNNNNMDINNQNDNNYFYDNNNINQNNGEQMGEEQAMEGGEEQEMEGGEEQAMEEGGEQYLYNNDIYNNGNNNMEMNNMNINNINNINDMNDANYNNNQNMDMNNYNYNEEEANENEMQNNNIDMIGEDNQNNGNNNPNDENDIESLKLIIYDLQQKCNSLCQENGQLKFIIQNNNKKEPNLELMENSIKQGSILLTDNKKKNEILKKKIIELENKNKELNYKLIEINQKLKKFQNSDNNQNVNMNKDEEVNRLNNIIDENEVKISKLEFDKKTLEQRLDEYQKFHENEIKLMLNYKNSELSVYQNLIDKYQNENNNELNAKNIQMQINKMRKEINVKNQIINSLNNKISQFNENYNKQLNDIRRNSFNNINQSQDQVKQLMLERNELLRKNEELTRGLLQFNDKVKEVNAIYNDKTENYNKNIVACKEKMKEYRLKIDMLTKKINNLNMIIKKLRLRNNTSLSVNNDNISFGNGTGKGKRNNISYNLNDNYLSDINDNNLTDRYKGFIRNKCYSEYNASPYIQYRRNNVPNTDSRANIKNNLDFDKFENLGCVEEQLDLSQKKYLEKYKSFLNGLDEQLK